MPVLLGGSSVTIGGAGVRGISVPGSGIRGDPVASSELVGPLAAFRVLLRSASLQALSELLNRLASSALRAVDFLTLVGLVTRYETHGQQ